MQAHPSLLAGGPQPTAVIADDERLMREQLRARLAEVWPALQIVAEARNGMEAVQACAERRPDVAFLDIRMPGQSGIEAARDIVQLPASGAGGAERAGGDVPEIVFITAYDQHAVEAFEQGAADYVLKPAERERLARTVARVQHRLHLRLRGEGPATVGEEGAGGSAAPAHSLQQVLHALAAVLPGGGAAAAAAPRSYLRWLQAGVGSQIQMVAVEDVLFFISDEKYTRVQCAGSEALIRKPIKELVDELDPGLFWQIHRSTLVNLKAIAGVHRDERGRQIVSIKGRRDQLEVSRSFIGLFKGM